LGARRPVLLLRECPCGEPLLDHQRKCPQCGNANANWKASRWRIFWPEVDSLVGADEAITLGYWAAFLAAGLGAITAFIPGVGAGAAALVDVVLYGLCGGGIMAKWRAAAIVGFLLICLNIVFSSVQGRGVGVLAALIFVGLLNGVRGTFATARLSQMQPPSKAV
jgi:hypothetical protein